MGCASAARRLSPVDSFLLWSPAEPKHGEGRSSERANASDEAHETLSLAGSCSEPYGVCQALRSYQLAASHP